MARSWTFRLVSLTLANVLLPLAVLVFAIGFFPYKPLLPGLATFQDDETSSSDSQGGLRPEPVFDRVIFMVVDALRSDFVYGYHSGFGFTQSLVRTGAALPFTAHASPPTVTMPRIKALTTGSVPSFADLISNLDESSPSSGAALAAQDSWLAQIKAQGGKLVFYGDDTWLRLFPSAGFFERAEGTASFLVSDFTEVDHNVTRHLPSELQRHDWNAMILHYLGLDHIGHKTGPQGPQMLPKQTEMDGVVQQIYEAMERESHLKNCLLVLAGDHGMNAGGNHGGSGPGETEPALVFVSPKLRSEDERLGMARQGNECPTSPKEGTEFHYYRKVEQSDIVPTLAGLMGFPIPRNSLGVFIRELAEVLWDDSQSQAQIMWQNARQVLGIVEAAFGGEGFGREVRRWRECWAAVGGDECGVGGEGGEVRALARLWGRVEEGVDGTTAVPDAQLSLAFLETSQEILSGAASSYDVPRLLQGILISVAAFVLAVLSSPSLWPPSTAGVVFTATSLLYAIMVFASSYVEEEQHFWYWVLPAWMTLFTIKSVIRSPQRKQKLRSFFAGVVVVAVHRLAIRWNQTGQKHTGEPDVVHGFFPEHHVDLWLLILATYGYNCWMLAGRTFLDLLPGGLAAMTAVVLTVPAVVFKLNFTHADAPELVRDLAFRIRMWSSSYSLVSQAQVTFALLAVATVTVVALAVGLARGTELARKDGPAVNVTLAERLHYLLTLLLITQSRAANIPLFLGLALQARAVRYLLHSGTSMDGPNEQRRRNAMVSIPELAMTTLLLSHTYFFCAGGSNSISSVDLSNAYNGVGDYSVVAVGILLFTSNWNGPIWWCSAAVLMTFSKPAVPEREVVHKAGGESRSWIKEERAKLRQDALAVRSSGGSQQQPSGSWLWYVSLMTAFIASGMLAVMIACTLLRTHLFIWTVFSPKYLYAMAWCVGWHLLVNIGFGSALRQLGSRA
ncbi:hypothetical protein LTR62_008608 [Meristemomyces frigidus]|uniref:GPI ethanolamine phosphate transferase 2 n=1 Tax=Meristemomyces frigidus TaxID=1508187 RepID=A0AAN7YLU1_9PEZI|nr:hypothetical protein LTR62_008608 [Meristemomyces frigidus]